MAADGFDIGGALGNFNNIMAQGWRDRMDIQKEGDKNMRALELANITDARARQMQQESMAHADKMQAAKLQGMRDIYGAKQSGKESKEQQAALKEFTGIMNKDKNYVATHGMVNLADEAKVLIDKAQTNAAIANNLPIQLARLATGGQRLNMAEIQAQRGSNALLDKFMQMYQTGATGTLTPQNAQNMLGLVDVVSQNASKTLDKMHEDYASKLAQRPGFDFPTAFQKLSGKPYQPPQAPVQNAQMALQKIGAFANMKLQQGVPPAQVDAWRAKQMQQLGIAQQPPQGGTQAPLAPQPMAAPQSGRAPQSIAPVAPPPQMGQQPQIPGGAAQQTLPLPSDMMNYLDSGQQMDDLDAEFQKYSGAAPPDPVLTTQDRLVLNNIFDTQPKKRAAYLEQLGFEMNPKDDNEFRPLGSPKNAPFVGKVDPSAFSIKDWKSVYSKGGIAGMLKEAGADVGDVAVDMGIPALFGLVGGGEAAAGTAATGVGAPVAPIVGLLTGLVSGAGSHLATETVKQVVADKIFLNKNIPTDYKLAGLQALGAGIFKGGFTGIAGLKNRLSVSEINKTANAIENAAQRFSGGKLTPDILQEAAKNPDMFTKEAVQGADETISKLYKTSFGFKPPHIDDEALPEFVANRAKDINKDSTFGKYMATLNTAADATEKQLAADPRANIPLKNTIQGINDVLEPLYAKGKMTNSEDIAAVKELERYRDAMIGEVKKKVGPGVSQEELMDTPVDFSTVRQWGKTMKDGVKDNNGVTIPGGEKIMQAAGSGPGQLGWYLNKAGDAAGSDWSPIQAQRSYTKDLFNRAKNVFTPNNMQKAWLGNDDQSKLLIKGTGAEMDSLFGTDIVGDLQNANYQRAFKGMYNKPNQTFGSGAVLSDMAQAGTQGFAKGLGTGALLGYPIGMSKPLGIAIGIQKGLSEASKQGRMSLIKNPAEEMKNLMAKRFGMDQGYQQMMSVAGAGVPALNLPTAAGEAASKMSPQWAQTQSGQGNVDLDAEFDQFLKGSGQ